MIKGQSVSIRMKAINYTHWDRASLSWQWPAQLGESGIANSPAMWSHQKQSRKFRIVALKWPITKLCNPKCRSSQIQKWDCMYVKNWANSPRSCYYEQSDFSINLPYVWFPIKCTGPNPFTRENVTGWSEKLTPTLTRSRVPCRRIAIGCTLFPNLVLTSTCTICSSNSLTPSPRKIWKYTTDSGFKNKFCTHWREYCLCQDGCLAARDVVQFSSR